MCPRTADNYLLTARPSMSALTTASGRARQGTRMQADSDGTPPGPLAWPHRDHRDGAASLRVTARALKLKRAAVRRGAARCRDRIFAALAWRGVSPPFDSRAPPLGCRWAAGRQAARATLTLRLSYA